MKKLFFTFIALLIVFFSAWGIKLRMPINRPNNVQGEQQVAWYETRYTAPTAEEEWTLDPEIPVNYLPVAGEDEVYMVLDDSGNIVGYRHRTQQEDGSWLWTDIEDPNAEHYEKVDGLDHIYKVTDKDGTSSYQQYVRNEDGSYAYVPVNENGVPLDDGADATTIDTTHYVHKSGNVYGLYNDNGVLTGYRERVMDGENYVWKVTDPPQSSTSDLQEWSEAKKDNANQGDLSADSGDGTQNSGNNGVIVGGSGAESSQIDNGDGTYTKTETNVSTKTEDGYCITYKTTVTSVYDTNGTLISTQKDGPYEVSREKLNVSEDPSAASAADTIDAEVARVSGKVSYKTPYTCMEFQVTSMQARQLIDEAYQMAVSTLNEEDSNNPLFCPPFDLPDVSEFDEAPDNSEFVIGPAASKNIEALPAVEDLFQQDVPFSSEIEYPDPLSEDPAPVEPISDPDSLTYPLSDVLKKFQPETAKEKAPAASEEGIEAATKSDEDTKTAPVFYKGMLLIRCPKCGNTWGACYHEAIKQCHCKCGNAIPLKDLKKVFLKCTCGMAYKYMTNIEEEQFRFPCYGCKKEIQLFRDKDAYYTAGREDTAE